MTVLPVVTTKQQFGEDTLSITLRNVGGEPSAIQAELVIKTVSLWQYLKKLIDAGERTTPLNKTPEMAVQEATMQHDETSQGGYSFEPWQETRVTVFDWSNHYGLTVHSDTMAQSALDTYYGLHDALEQLAPKATETAPASAQTRESAPAPMVTPEAPKQPVNGVIQASRAPNPKETLYAEGQLVAFNVVKVSVGANKGSATYALWGTLGGGKYPLMTVYKCKPNSDENSLGYIAIKDTIVSMNLSLDKPEAHGNWRLTCQAAHKDGKEYLNPVSLEAL